MTNETANSNDQGRLTSYLATVVIVIWSLSFDWSLVLGH
jgi:hypothetical protein